MEKKLIKAILDVIKDVEDRPGLYGIYFEDHTHITGVPHIYFSNGYVAIRLDCGEFEGLRPINENMWVSGTQLKAIYQNMKTKDVCLNLHDDGLEGKVDFPEWWGKWVKDISSTDAVAIDPNIFKKLAPFGDMVMMPVQKNLNKIVSKLVLFSGKGINAIACPLIDKREKELCESK